MRCEAFRGSWSCQVPFGHPVMSSSFSGTHGVRNVFKICGRNIVKSSSFQARMEFVKCSSFQARMELVTSSNCQARMEFVMSSSFSSTEFVMSSSFQARMEFLMSSSSEVRQFPGRKMFGGESWSCTFPLFCLQLLVKFNDVRGQDHLQ